MLIKGVDIPDELLRAQVAGNLVVFAGAGVSNPPPSSLPLFGALTKRIGSGSGVDKEPDEPEDRYLGRLKKKGIHVHEATARILVNDQTKPHILHTLLAQLFDTPEKIRIVTTNFDTHFSTAAKESFGEAGEVFCAPALPLGDDFTGLVYLHGCAGKDPQRCVLTDEDFGRAYLTQAWASRFLAAMFTRYTVVFVGYSHNDPVMNYLARGLPPVSQTLRFAFTTDDDTSLKRWEFLGIRPIIYKERQSENPHEAITEAVEGWVGELRRGLLEKAQRIRAIVEAQPPLEGEDTDYIKFSLSEPDTARIFFKHARLPEWISWLEKHNFLQPVFDPRSDLSDFHRQLSLWLAEHFLAQHHQDMMAAVQRNHGKLHPQLCWFIWRRLCSRDHDPSISPVFSRWVALLLNQPNDVLRYDDWASLLNHCRFPDDKAASLLLFDLITRPRVLLKERWRFLDIDEADSQKVDFDINLLRLTEHWVDEGWNKLLKPNLPAYANLLEPVVTANLTAAHLLMEIFGRATRDYDLFRIYRQSIEPHGQHRSPKTIDVLVDAARDVLNHLLETQPNRAASVIEKWFESDAPILRRLAIWGTAKRADVSSDDKLQWLLGNDLLFQFKTDVFWFLQETYSIATDEVRGKLLSRVTQGPIGEQFERLEERTKTYEIFNVLVWLKRIAPKCALASTQLELLKKENPDFAEREEPELDFSSSGARFIDPTEGFNLEEIASQPTESFLENLLAWQPRHAMDRSRLNYCSTVSAITAKKPEWGIAWIQTLIARNLSDADLWEYVCQGWRNANPTPKQWQQILDLVEAIPAPAVFFAAFAEVLEHGSRREQYTLPTDRMGQAQRIAERIWKEALATTAPQPLAHGDWLAEAINRPGGRLAEFWLQRISISRKLAGESWLGLPSDIAANMTEMFTASSGAAAHARVVLASQLHYFFSLDPPFATKHIFPLFDWKADAVRAEQCWQGYLFWGRWLPGFTEALLPHFTEGISRIATFPKDARAKLVEHIAGIALFLIPNPLATGWLTDALQRLNNEDREELARLMNHFLDDAEASVAEGVWERWFREYWKLRLLGTPKPLLAKEANELLFCSLSFGKYFPEAVSLAVSMGDSVKLEHGILIYRIDKKNLVKSFPNAAADLLLFFLSRKPPCFYADEHVANVWQHLRSGGVDKALLLKIREAMFRLGHDPGEL